MSTHFTLKKVSSLFGVEASEVEQKFTPEKFRSGALFKKGYPIGDIPKIGEAMGFFKKPVRPTSICVFTTKGGVLKSTLTLNLARMAALHNIKTCVVGLDIQCDVTAALGHDAEIEEGELGQLIGQFESTKGLADLFSNNMTIKDLVIGTDIENLDMIPETPELAALNDSLNNIVRREYWLKEKVIGPLKEHYDLVIMDCSPNWNKLTTNALVACDLLVSPLECKINNFRNFKVFRQFLREFKGDMHLNFQSLFVPTRYSSARKLSLEIKDWYQSNVVGCLPFGIKEGVLGEEATALNLSVFEHASSKPMAKEFRALGSAVSAKIAEQETDLRMGEPTHSYPM